MASSNRNEVHFVIGNTYAKIPLSEAKLDRSGNYRKIHDWTLFVDILRGDPDLIERVSFDLGASFFQPSTFTCNTPVPIRSRNGNNAITSWRFQTRQQTYGAASAKIVIRGAGGSVLECSHKIVLSDASPAAAASVVQTFRERRPLRPLRMLKMPEEQRFGIELELTSATHVPAEIVAQNLQQQHSMTVVEVVRDYGSGRSASSHWKLVPDSSIVCNVNMPNCNRFELVSPILQGGSGLQQVSQILQRLNDYSRREPNIQLAVNKSMGFHVHIDVSALSVKDLIKVCQNYIKYEDVMDSFMPPSRRNGSNESNQYFQSNRESVAENIGANSNKTLHEALGACQDLPSLAQMMNLHGRYYKLNLQNLVSTSRYQPTLEFRQHSTTMNFSKVGAWIRFCHAFCHNSAKLAPPSPFRQGRSVDEKFDALFQYVVKDRALRNFYRERRLALEEQVNQEDGPQHAPPCCTGCASGGSCLSRAYVK